MTTDAADAARRMLLAARRYRRRAAAQAYGEYLRGRTPEQVTADHALIESSNDLALPDASW